MQDKTCGTCKQNKPLTEFSKWKHGDGYQPSCKECSRTAQRDWRKANARNNLPPLKMKEALCL